NRLTLLQVQSQRQGREFPPISAELKSRILDRLIDEQALKNEALRQGFSVTDEQVNEGLVRLAQNLGIAGGIPELARALTSIGLPFERVREETRTELLISAVQRRAVSNQISVSDQEARALIEREGLNQGQVRLSEIFVALPSAPTPEQIAAGEQRIVALAQALGGGADFADLATRSSDGAQAIAGGDLGWRELSGLADAFRSALTQVDNRGISQPFRSRAGFHILQLNGKRGSETVLIGEARARHILLRPDAINDVAATQALALELRGQLMGGASFAALAKEYSSDPVSASKGGDLGWADPSQYVPAFAAAVSNLPLNQVSEPIETRFGWHLVEVLDRRTVESENVGQLQRAKQIIIDRQADEIIAAWTREVVEASYIERL
ncbi:MAG: peptidylprolyl isomerase, partial [Litorivicinus sp.]